VAIAAMGENRVIGDGSRIPWHLPEDFKWFKRMTTGHILVMGRKTYESIGRPLPNRETWVLTRQPWSAPGVRVLRALDELDPAREPREIFICGGAQVYAQALPRCSDLYLTHVRRAAQGDILFPPFESLFVPVETLQESPDFTIVHYRNEALT
jgi:dihydrofolate reductase